jgi:methyltransferase (TIGR00027 family)
MGWRLAPEFPNVEFFEIDHPATASLKAKGIKEMGPRPNLHLVAEDLSERRLSDVLSDNGDWDSGAWTAIVAEGLLQYLPPEAVRDLFVQCSAVTGECRMVFTYISTREDGRPDCGPRTRLVLWLLKLGGEPWLWSIRPEELGQFLESVGWTNTPEPEGASGKHGVELYAVATKSRRSQAE